MGSWHFRRHDHLNSYTSTELLELSRAEKDPRKRIRLLAVSHFVEGKNRSEISRILKVARRSVNVWVANYLEHGIAGLEAKKPKGRSSYLTKEQQQALSEYILQQSQSDAGGRLTGKAIQQYISEQFACTYHPNAIYKLLKQLGFSWITSRSRHPRQSQQAQDVFKKLSTINAPSDTR